MSISSANSAGTATRRVETLTSGTSYTVPAKVFYVNATLIGAGGSGHSSTNAGDYTGSQMPDGKGGQIVTTTVTTTPGASIAYAIGAGGAAKNTGQQGGSSGGSTTFTGATTAGAYDADLVSTKFDCDEGCP